MNLPPIQLYEEQAIDVVVHIINAAKFTLGERMNLMQLARSRDLFTHKYKVSLANLNPPFSETTLSFLTNAITKQWKLTPTLHYVLRFVKSTRDEVSVFFYFEAIFSQPTAPYPIPQATASVYFRLEDKPMLPSELRGSPMMYFWLEGSGTNHDIRHVNLTVDWILAVIQMKAKLFKRFEEIGVF